MVRGWTGGLVVGAVLAGSAVYAVCSVSVEAERILEQSSENEALREELSEIRAAVAAVEAAQGSWFCE